MKPNPNLHLFEAPIARLCWCYGASTCAACRDRNRHNTTTQRLVELIKPARISHLDLRPVTDTELTTWLKGAHQTTLAKALRNDYTSGTREGNHITFPDDIAIVPVRTSPDGTYCSVGKYTIAPDLVVTDEHDARIGLWDPDRNLIILDKRPRIKRDESARARIASRSAADIDRIRQTWDAKPPASVINFIALNRVVVDHIRPDRPVTVFYDPLHGFYHLRPATDFGRPKHLPSERVYHKRPDHDDMCDLHAQHWNVVKCECSYMKGLCTYCCGGWHNDVPWDTELYTNGLVNPEEFL
jgi:hypothetical protein